MIIVNTETFEQYENGNIVGQIYCQFDGMFFPEEHWNDFPVIILHWWIEAFLAEEDAYSHDELDFMDGPYSMRMERLQDRIEISFLDHVFTLSAKAWKASLLAAADKVLAACQSMSTNKDIKQLASSARRLQSMSIV